MINTKIEKYTFRSGKKSKIYLEITEEINDKENNQYIFNVVDYGFDEVKDANNNVSLKKTIIHTKLVNIPYSVRDILKNSVIQQYNITGTESEVNKNIVPYALLMYNSQDPVYGLSANDFELTQ